MVAAKFTQPESDLNLDAQELRSGLTSQGGLFVNGVSFNKPFDHAEPQLLACEVLVASPI